MLILASSSPRRRALLASLEIPFDVVPSRAPERAATAEDQPAAYALELARGKADEVAQRDSRATVLAADTVVTIDGKILGKPSDPKDAMRMLRLLRGREHQVTTAVVAGCGSSSHAGHVTSRVKMRRFSDEEAQEYVSSGEPMDKAGAYAVQEFGGSFVEAVEGCYNTVVGLPLCLTIDLLGRCGVYAALPPASSCSACTGKGH